MKMEYRRARAALRTVLPLVLLLLPRLVGATPSGTATGMALWHEAVKMAARSADYLPGTVYTDVTVTDAKGNLKSSQETWSRLSVGPDGSVATTVVRSLKDGKDNTANAQAQLDRNPERGRFDSSFLPMMPSNQNRVDVAPTGTTRRVGGVRCEGFSFRMKGGRDRTTEGTVWIEEKSGAPLLLEFTLDPLPPGASEISNTLRFETTAGGAWQLASLDTYAKGRLLFFERIFRLHMVFSSYFPYSPPAKGASQ